TNIYPIMRASYQSPTASNEGPIMKIISINTGLPREIFHEGRLITTGIFKAPIAGRVRVNALNIEGDRQADLTVHGGVSKAIYAYPAEHYEFWRKELPDVEFP